MTKNVHIEKHIIQEKMYYNNELVLNYTIEYPQFRCFRFYTETKRINEFYKMKAIEFQNYCRQTLYKMAVKEYQYSIANNYPVRAFEAMLVFNITYNQNCTVSLYFDRYEYTGGAHGNTVRTSDTWNMQIGSRIPLRQLFTTSMAYSHYIFKSINHQIDKQIKNEQYFYFDNHKENVEEYFDTDDFYLTTDGVVIYFQLYTIAPYSSGIVEFTIPYSEGCVNAPCCK